jgi:hypothetical protein
LEELIELPLDGYIIEGIRARAFLPSTWTCFRRIEAMGVPRCFTNGYHRTCAPPTWSPTTGA